MKALTTLLFGLSLIVPAPAVFALGDELGCVRGDCENGEGTLVKETPQGKTIYRGHFRDGHYHGFGRLEYVDDKAVYKGYFRGGWRHGRGTFWDADNNVYIGEWVANRRNGEGVQAFAVQDWREDRYTELWLKENSENYSGTFKNDVFYGQGTYRWKDGTTYTGGWVANKKHGEGFFNYGHGHVVRHMYELDERKFGF